MTMTMTMTMTMMMMMMMMIKSQQLGSNKPKNVSTEQKKRERTAIRQEQQKELRKVFAAKRFIKGQDRNNLSKHLNLSQTTINCWFRNRRAKEKRSNKTTSQNQPEKNQQQQHRSKLVSLQALLQQDTSSSVNLEDDLHISDTDDEDEENINSEDYCSIQALSQLGTSVLI